MRADALEDRNREWLARVCAGETVAAVAADAGVSRQRVDQALTALAPERPWRALARERAAIRAEVERVRPGPPRDCRVCGARFESHVANKTTCDDACAERWQALMYAVSDARRASQRHAVARQILRTGEGSVAFATHVLEGTVAERGRWLIEGSAPWRAAVEACRAGWPVFDELPADVQRQVREACP